MWQVCDSDLDTFSYSKGDVPWMAPILPGNPVMAMKTTLSFQFCGGGCGLGNRAGCLHIRRLVVRSSSHAEVSSSKNCFCSTGVSMSVHDNRVALCSNLWMGECWHAVSMYKSNQLAICCAISMLSKKSGLKSALVSLIILAYYKFVVLQTYVFQSHSSVAHICSIVHKFSYLCTKCPQCSGILRHLKQRLL